jgi:hypothetical protein
MGLTRKSDVLSLKLAVRILLVHLPAHENTQQKQFLLSRGFWKQIISEWYFCTYIVYC